MAEVLDLYTPLNISTVLRHGKELAFLKRLGQLISELFS